MPPPLNFDHCSFEGNEFQVNINYNNCNFGAPGHHSGTPRPPTDIPSDESGQADNGVNPPQDRGNPAPSTGFDVPNQTQQVPNGVSAGLSEPQASQHTNQDSQSPPPPYDESESAPFFTSAFQQFADPPWYIPRSDTPSSLNVEDGSSLRTSLSSLTSESETDPKHERSEEEERDQLTERQEEEDGDDDEEEEVDEEEAVDAAATEDEKWEVESKEKEDDGNPTELEDVQLSIDRSDGSSSASMGRPAGLLSDTGSGLTGGQQTGDQPLSLHSASSAEHPPETEMNSSPPSPDAHLSLASAVPSTTTRQEQNGDTQSQLTAGLLRDLARSDPLDTAAQDETDPEMMARLVRLRGDDSPDTGGMSGESGEGTTVEPTEQAAEPSNGHAQPPHPHIMLHVSPEEPIEGDRVDFELLNVPLHGIGDVEWKHCGILMPQAFGLHYTINSVGQKDAGVYQCAIYKDKEKINIVAVVEVTLHVKKSTDVTGQPCLEEKGGSGGSTGDRNGNTSMQTDASLPGSGRDGTSNQSTQGGGDPASVTSVLGATAMDPEYESLQQRYLQGQRLLKEHDDLSYYPISPFPAGQRDCIVMNAGETTTPFDPMLHKLTAIVAPDGPVTTKKTSLPNRTAPLTLSIERKDSASFMKSAEEGEKGRPAGGRGSSDERGEDPCGSGSSCPPGQRQKDARCPDRSPVQPKKLAVPAQPDIDSVYYSIPLSELMDDADLLEEVKVKLDPDCCGRKNWRHLGAKLGNIPRDQLEYFACHGRRTEAVLERVTSERPDTSVGDLMNVLYQIKRGDVVETIKQNL